MSKPPASDLTSHLGYWLRYVSNHVSNAFAQKLAVKDVTVAEWVLMRTLYAHEAIAPSAVAREMGMTRGAITKLADRLIAKQLATRKADLVDGRAQTLALTKAAESLVPELAALADRNDAEFFDHLSIAERRGLADLLKGIVERHGLTAPPVE
jgi:DNA-binding MarR family transcriptional regulator